MMVGFTTFDPLHFGPSNMNYCLDENFEEECWDDISQLSCLIDAIQGFQGPELRHRPSLLLAASKAAPTDFIDVSDHKVPSMPPSRVRPSDLSLMSSLSNKANLLSEFESRDNTVTRPLTPTPATSNISAHQKPASIVAAIKTTPVSLPSLSNRNKQTSATNEYATSCALLSGVYDNLQAGSESKLTGDPADFYESEKELLMKLAIDAAFELN